LRGGKNCFGGSGRETESGGLKRRRGRGGGGGGVSGVGGWGVGTLKYLAHNTKALEKKNKGIYATGTNLLDCFEERFSEVEPGKI